MDSQCNNFIVLRLTNERDKGVIKNLLPDALKSTIEFLPLLDVGEALVVGDAILLPSKRLLYRNNSPYKFVSFGIYGNYGNVGNYGNYGNIGSCFYGGFSDVTIK